jgi:hypothetical protein
VKGNGISDFRFIALCFQQGRSREEGSTLALFLRGISM